MNNTITRKDWVKFIIYTIVIFVLGAIIGLSVGRNHPKPSVKQMWMNDIEAEVNNLVEYQRVIDEEYRVNTAIRDSIISALKREIVKGDSVELPIFVNVNIIEE